MTTYTLGTIREFRTAKFRVIVDAIEDDAPDLSFDEDGSVRRGIDDGTFTLFTARARVIHDDLGEVASDYLGGCIYETLQTFQDHRRCRAATRALRARGDSTAVCGSYFADMVRTVCTDARKRLRTLRDGLNGLTIR